MTQDVFILGGKRTPMGEYVGALKDISAIELGVIASRAALETTGVGAEEIDHTIMGNALQTSGDAIYGARHVALKAGVPFDRLDYGVSDWARFAPVLFEPFLKLRHLAGTLNLDVQL
ncbi:MAG: thiolase family protein, partial [Pyrinomonadaceae bacterium]